MEGQQKYPGSAAQDTKQPEPQLMENEMGTVPMEDVTQNTRPRDVLTLQDTGTYQYYVDLVTSLDTQEVAGLNAPGDKTALQQLKQILSSPESPEQQQQQIIAILRSNPKIMAAYIEQRQETQQRQNHVHATTENVEKTIPNN